MARGTSGLNVSKDGKGGLDASKDEGMIKVSKSTSEQVNHETN